MKAAYLEVTFRHGRPLAAYYYLPRRTGQKSFRTVRMESGLLADFDQQGRPIGIEITAPGKTTATVLNRVLLKYGLPELASDDLRPLRAA
jgi:uncharacterized protein YuzE